MCSVSIYTWAFPPKTLSDVCLEITSVMRKTASFYRSDRLVKRKSCLPHSEGLSRTTWKGEETHFHLMNPLIIHSLACTTSPRLLQQKDRPCRHRMRGKKKKKNCSHSPSLDPRVLTVMFSHKSAAEKEKSQLLVLPVSSRRGREITCFPWSR